MVVWESTGSAGSDTDNSSIQGQRYDASGSAVGSEFQVNSYTTGSQDNPSVGVDSEGDFVVVWESDWSPGSDPFYAVLGQRYDASGNALGAEFQVNTTTLLKQDDPSVALDVVGNFVVVWRSSLSAGSDTDNVSIQGQRYDASGSPVTSSSCCRLVIILPPDLTARMHPSRASATTPTEAPSEVSSRSIPTRPTISGPRRSRSTRTGTSWSCGTA